MTLLAKIFGCGLENLFTWLLDELKGPFPTWDQKVKKKKRLPSKRLHDAALAYSLFIVSGLLKSPSALL